VMVLLCQRKASAGCPDTGRGWELLLVDLLAQPLNVLAGAPNAMRVDHDG